MFCIIVIKYFVASVFWCIAFLCHYSCSARFHICIISMHDVGNSAVTSLCRGIFREFPSAAEHILRKNKSIPYLMLCSSHCCVCYVRCSLPVIVYFCIT